MTRMLPQVMTAEPWTTAAAERPMNVAFTFAGLQALGLPDGDPGLLPGRVPRRHGGARRAPRRPRAERARALGGRPGDRRGARARHGLRGRRRAPRGAPGEVLREDRRGSGATSLVHCSAPRRCRAARDHFGFFDGIAQPAVGGRGVARAAGRRPARRRGRLARRAHRRVPARLRRRGRHAARRAAGAVRPQRDVRRLPQAADGRGRVPALRRRARAATTPAARSCWRPRSSGAGPTARRSRSRPTRPDPGARRRPAAHQRLRLRRRPRRACAARSARTSAAPTRATPRASSTAG